MVGKDTCTKAAGTEYKSRPSPPYHANDCKGATKTGNDGTPYVSLPDKRGVHRWTRKITKPRGTKYEIHDNRSRPFFVYVTPSTKTLTAYRTKYEESGKFLLDKKVYETTYTKLFVGDNILHEKDAEPCCTAFSKGNSLLAHLSGHKYVYIGERIYTFETVEKDVIDSYQSGVGNNDVPYPVAIGKSHLYFMLDAVALPKSMFRVEKGASLYGQYYGWEPMQANAPAIGKINDFEEREAQRKKHKALMEKIQLRLKHKIVHPRHYFGA